MKLRTETPTERKIANPESKSIYKSFQESIRSGTCQLKDLRLARQKSDDRDKPGITEEQYTLLVTQYAENLEKRVNTDPLTNNIYNKAFLKPAFDEIYKELNPDIEKRKFPVQAVMVIFLDINDFKEFNDTHGHLAGDQVLREVADELKAAVKKVDLVFRVGGDEFLVLMPITDNNPQLLASIFERIQNRVNAKLASHKLISEAGDIATPIKLAMGFDVLKKGDKITAEQLINAADNKMYQDKNRRENL